MKTKTKKIFPIGFISIGFFILFIGACWGSPIVFLGVANTASILAVLLSCFVCLGWITCLSGTFLVQWITYNENELCVYEFFCVKTIIALDSVIEVKLGHFIKSWTNSRRKVLSIKVKTKDFITYFQVESYSRKQIRKILDILNSKLEIPPYQ